MMKLFFKVREVLLQLFSIKTMGARALVIQKDQILLIKHTYTPGWCSIGGHVDAGESGLQALRRELQEEVGIDLKESPSILGFYHNPRKNRDDYVIVYICKKFTQKKVTSPEILEAKWFSLYDLPPDTAPGTRRRIEEYLGTRPLNDRW